MHRKDFLTRKTKWWIVVFLFSFPLAVFGEEEDTKLAQKSDSASKMSPWIGAYPMSIFTRARTSKTVGKDHLSLSLKLQCFDYDEIRRSDGCYHDLGSNSKYKYSNVLCAKYGWAKDHHLALGIPYLWNNSEMNGVTFNNDGLGNIYLFEKWNLIKETESIPGIAVDVWHYFPTGNTQRKVGNDDYAWKFTTEISKAWEWFSVHVNPGYQISEGRDEDVILGDAAVILTPWEKFWPAVEYNYTYTESKGRCNELIPGFIWKFLPNASFKLGAVINLDATTQFRDEVGLVAKIFYRF